MLGIGPSSPHYTAGAWIGARSEEKDTYVMMVSMEPGHTSLTGCGELGVDTVAVAVSSRRHTLLRRGGTRILQKDRQDLLWSQDRIIFFFCRPRASGASGRSGKGEESTKSQASDTRESGNMKEKQRVMNQEARSPRNNFWDWRVKFRQRFNN